MAFTAADVKDLREKTGCGMMECKKALTEADGDMEKAINVLREKGLAAAAKKSGRIAAEGAVVAYTDEAAKVTALVEVNAETDFVAKNQEFQNFATLCAKTVAEQDPADVDALMAMTPAGESMDIAALLREKILQIGENIKVRRFARYEGNVVSYIHGGGRIGVMLKLDVDDTAAANEAVMTMGKDIAMQVAAINPLYLNKEAVPADKLDEEKNILMTQIQNDPKSANKPEAIIMKMVDGRISKFYKENCLLQQEFVKDNSMTVAEYVDTIAKEVGTSIQVVDYVRFEKGEGLEKRNDNFADEVASMM